MGTELKEQDADTEAKGVEGVFLDHEVGTDSTLMY
jgi:hypothetical protein